MTLLFIGFWIKENIYYETANADFKGPLVINVLRTSGFSQTFSTVNGLNKMYDADWQGAVPTIKVSREQNPKINSTKTSDLRSIYLE